MAKRAMGIPGTIQTDYELSLTKKEELKEDEKGQAARIFEHFISSKRLEFEENPNKKIAFLYAANDTQKKEFRNAYSKGTPLPKITGGGQALLFKELMPLINAEVKKGNLQQNKVLVLPIDTMGTATKETLDEDLTFIQQKIKEGYTVYGIPFPTEDLPEKLKPPLFKSDRTYYAIGGGESKNFYQGADICHNDKYMSFGEYVQHRLQEFEQRIFSLPAAAAPAGDGAGSEQLESKSDSDSPPPATAPADNDPDLENGSASPGPTTSPSDNKPAPAPVPEHKHDPAPAPANKPPPTKPHSIDMEEINGVIKLTGTNLTAEISGYQDEKKTPTLTLKSLNQIKDGRNAQACEADINGMLSKLQEKLDKNADNWKTVNGKFVLEVISNDLDPQALAELKKIINASDKFITAEKAATLTKTPLTAGIQPRKQFPTVAQHEESESESDSPSPR
jgi:hypothetical protein